MLSKILPVILAGGKSSRMGTNKLYLDFNGVFFLDNIINLLYKVGFKNILVSGKVEGYNFLEDDFYFIGPFGAIYKAFFNKHLNCYSYYLFVPIDMPFLDESLVLNLILNKVYGSLVCYENFKFPLLISKNLFFKVFFEKLVYNKKHLKISISLLLSNLPCVFIKQNLQFSFYNVNYNFDLIKIELI